jgi:hypothetical protein
MTNVYKIEVVVVDYDDVGEHGITRLIGRLRTSYNVLSYITNIHKAWVDDPDTVGRKLLIQHKLPELFSPWQPITTAPSKKYVLVYHPTYGVQHAKYDAPTWWIFYPDHYFGCQPMLNPAPLYWQPLPQPPQL